ncbi:hypothetical protein BN1723_020272, partial [Verticillium longisporum]
RLLVDHVSPLVCRPRPHQHFFYRH